MENEKIYEGGAANVSNAALLNVEASAVDASRSLFAMELARCVVSSSSKDPITPEDAVKAFVKVGGSLDDPALFALFCRYLPDSVKKGAEEPFVSSSSSISYVRNVFSDRAFDTLDAVFGGMRVVYSENSKGCCESVYYDEVDCCLLPFESSEEGLLLSFRRLMLKYELKVAAVVKIPTGEESYSSFALLADNADDVLGNLSEVYIPAAGGDELSRICRILSVLDVAPERVTSVPSRDKLGYDLHLCIKGEPHKLDRALYCLEAYYKTCISLGKYKIYNTERNIYER